jgi:hypothetical protein
MNVTIDQIHKFFETYGWRCDYDEETRTWHTGFRGRVCNFPIFVQLTENWLYLILTPFVNAPVNPLCEPKLHRLLLELNHGINMAKFGIDADGDVVLSVELPTENIGYSQFADGLNALGYYADVHYLPVLNTAQNPDYVRTDQAGEASEDGTTGKVMEAESPETPDEDDSPEGRATKGRPVN